ncbi:hypothetical protein [Phenylobacterium koreense]|uniref:Glycosyltransferase RgtA/B/C/D-like domain-containing protein n=1 Tax=Phenylobacterium koreense TaxID=266125 RepID=A0ABV2EJD6_9CAUL
METAAGRTLKGVLLLGFLLVLAAGLPPHLSVDSVMALYEGRLQVRETFGPVLYARIVGLADGLPGGLGLYVALSAASLFAALAWAPRLRPTTSWWAVPVAVVFILSPTVLIFQGIVWKDVLFANLTVFGFVALAFGLTSRRPRGWLALLASGLVLAVAMSIRQNGFVFVAGAGAAVAWVLGRRLGWPKAIALGGAWVLLICLAAAAMGQAAQPRRAGPDKALGVGLRILQHYDVVGILARDPEAQPTGVAQAGRPEAAALIRDAAPQAYSPERVDFFERRPDLAPALWKTPPGVMRAQWLALISSHPTTYLTHRWEVFRWLVAPPDRSRCVPVFVGVTGPPAILARLGMEPRSSAKDRALARFGQAFVATPLYSHLFSAAVAALVMAALLWRREDQDIVVALFMASALAFAASFFVISIACDHRYLYALDLAAAAGALYLALQPSVRRNFRPMSAV